MYLASLKGEMFSGKALQLYIINQVAKTRMSQLLGPHFVCSIQPFNKMMLKRWIKNFLHHFILFLLLWIWCKILITQIDPGHEISVWKNSFRFDYIFPCMLLSGYNICCFMNSDITVASLLSHHCSTSTGPICLETDSPGFSLAFMTASGRIFLLEGYFL